MVNAQALPELATPYTRLVLGGGEMKGIAQLGALHHFWMQGDLSHESITHYAGTSVGSLISLLLVCGYTPYEIWNEIYDADSLLTLQPRSPISTVFSSFGLMPVDGAIGKVKHLLEARFPSNPTLAELRELTGKTLVVAVTNFTNRQIEYCSYLDTPNLSCLDAVRASCAIPGLFRKVEINGSAYLDGALLDNFPLSAVDNGTSPLLGISLTAQNVTGDGFIEFLRTIWSLPIDALTTQSIQRSGTNCRIVELETKSVSPLQFVLEPEIRRRLFVSGFKNVSQIKEEQFLTIPGYTPRPQRVKSTVN